MRHSGRTVADGVHSSLSRLKSTSGASDFGRTKTCPLLADVKWRWWKDLIPTNFFSKFVQEGLPIVCWNYDCALWCSCELGNIDIGIGVDNIGKVSQSACLRTFDLHLCMKVCYGCCSYN